MRVALKKLESLCEKLAQSPTPRIGTAMTGAAARAVTARPRPMA
jgi:hypothetical protein